MSDPVQYDLASSQLGFLNRVPLRIPIEKDVQFGHFRNPASVYLPVQLDAEPHSRSVTPSTLACRPRQPHARSDMIAGE